MVSILAARSVLTLRLVCLIQLLVSLPATTDAGQFVRIAGEVEIAVPDNWSLTTDTLDFPVQLIHYSDSAEILLFRSQIDGKDMIAGDIELKESVDLVIENVILSLPDGQLRTSTGFYETFRTGFTLEFVSTDSTTGTLLEHRLKGIIYRHPDDYQLLFTVWGKAAVETFPNVKEAISFVQDNFAYRGEQENEVFAPASMSYWPLALVIMALAGLLLLRPRRRGTDKTQSPGAPRPGGQ